MTIHKLSTDNKWLMVFRATIALGAIALPSMIALQVWIISQVHALFMQQEALRGDMKTFVAIGPRYTPSMARADNLELERRILTKVEEHYPPAWLIKEFESMSRRLEALENGG